MKNCHLFFYSRVRFKGCYTLLKPGLSSLLSLLRIERVGIQKLNPISDMNLKKSRIIEQKHYSFTEKNTMLFGVKRTVSLPFEYSISIKIFDKSMYDLTELPIYLKFSRRITEMF